MSAELCAEQLLADPGRPSLYAVGRRIIDIAKQMKTDPEQEGPFFYDKNIAGALSEITPAECSQRMAEYLSQFKGHYKRAVEELVEENILDAAVLNRLPIAAFAPMFLVQSAGQAQHGADIKNGFVVLKNMRNELSGVHELTHLLLPGIEVSIVNEGFEQAVAKIIYEKMTQWRPDYADRYQAFYSAHETLFWETSRLSGYGLREWTRIGASMTIIQNTRVLLRREVQVNGIIGPLVDHVNYLEDEYTRALLPRESAAISELNFDDFQATVAKKITQDLAVAPLDIEYNKEYARTP